MLARRLAVALIACAAAGAGRAQVDPTAPADELRGVLAGIVHYTRWPDAVTPLRVCVDTRDEFADAAAARRFAEAISELGSTAVTIEPHRLDTGAAGLLDCHALFVGNAPPAVWRRLLRELANRPVLTIGPGEDFCSWGGMFCLERSAATLRVRANLDAISRGGLRVNPQLLRLTQRDPKVPR